MININPSYHGKQVGIGTQLKPELRIQLDEFLRNNISVLSWKIKDMVGINPKIMTHEINIEPIYKPVRKKRRKLGTKRAKAVNNEVDKLLKASSICEVKYPE